MCISLKPSWTVTLFRSRSGTISSTFTISSSLQLKATICLLCSYHCARASPILYKFDSCPILCLRKRKLKAPCWHTFTLSANIKYQTEKGRGVFLQEVTSSPTFWFTEFHSKQGSQEVDLLSQGTKMKKTSDAEVQAEDLLNPNLWKNKQ